MKSTLRLVCLATYFLINLLFAYKYSSRSFGHPLFLSLIYVLGVVIILFIAKKIKSKWIETDQAYLLILILYVTGLVILFKFIPVNSLNVDRWSVISSFWHNVFNGEYPYNARSHMGNYPGPLPFYFVLMLPFNLAKEVGFSGILAVILLARFLRINLSARDSLAALLALIFSIAIFWEVSVRSTIFFNSVLFLLYMYWLISIDLGHRKKYVLAAVLGGLLLSTRTIFAIPLIIFCIYLFRSKEIGLGKIIRWILLLGAVFLLTFLPFLIWYSREFFARNPFTVQSEYLLPLGLASIFLLLSGFIGWICVSKQYIPIYTMLLFVLVFMVYVVFVSIKSNVMTVYLNSQVDISYSLFVFPFLLFYAFSHNSMSKRIREQ